MIVATDQALKETFAKLRPLCAEITENPSIECLNNFQDVLLNSDTVALFELQEYVLFAFRALLKQLKIRSENFQIEFLRCLKVLVQQSGEISDVKIFNELIHNVIINISPPTDSHNDTSNAVSICEEIQLECVLVIDSLFASATFEVLKSFYDSSDSLLFLGHAVSIFLRVVETEKLRNLRLASFQVLLRVAFCCVQKPGFKSSEVNGNAGRSFSENNVLEKFCTSHPNNEDNSKFGENNLLNIQNLQFTVGSVFASFLPGISISMAKVAIADSKQSQLITAYSIATLTRILERTFSDEIIAQSKEKKFAYLTGQEKFKGLLVNKTDDWISGTTEKLKTVIQRVSQLSDDSRWKVRGEILKMSTTLLLTCSRNLSNCSETFLNIVISGLVDKEPSVQQLAQSSIQSLMTNIKIGSGIQLIDLVENNLFQLVENLPAMLGPPNDMSKLRGLRLMNGHVKLLGAKTSCLFFSTTHIELLMNCLFKLLEFDCSSLVLEDDFSGQHFGQNEGQHFLSSYFFKNFIDGRIIEEAVLLLNEIGRLCDLQIITDQLLDVMITSKKFRKQSAFCLVEILNGARLSSDVGTEECCDWTTLEPIIDCIIDQVLDKSLWTETCEPFRVLTDIQPVKHKNKSDNSFVSKLLITPLHAGAGNYNDGCDGGISRRSALLQSDGGSKQEFFPKELKDEITFACLLLDVLGSSALLAGLNFEVKLSKVLLPTLERMGSSRAEIRARAHRSLFLMSWATCSGQKTFSPGPTDDAIIAGMIIRCSDYLMSSVLPCLRTVARDPRVLTAMRVVVELAIPKSSPIEQNSSFDSGFSQGVSTDLPPSSPHSADPLLAPCQKILHIVHSAFKQIMSSFDNHYCDYSIDFWRLLHKITKLVSSVVEMESSVSPSLVSRLNVISDTQKSSSTSSIDHDTNCRSAEPHENLRRTKVEIMSKKLMEFVLELEKKRKALEDFNVGDSGGVCGDLTEKRKEGNVNVDDENEEKVPVPYYVGMLEQILERCQHFLISPQTQIRMITLDVITAVCPLLKLYQDNLLPLVHKNWSPFGKRFADSEHFVCIKAFDTLRALTESAGDFMKKRVVNEVIPKVNNLLQSLAERSRKSQPNYKYTSACQLQKCILSNIGNLCKQADMKGQLLFNVICSCLPYLSSLQPLSLQEACVETFKEFIKIEPDAVWLLLTDVYCPSQILTPPPGSSFEPIKLSGPNKRNEFTDNVMALYKILEYV